VAPPLAGTVAGQANVRNENLTNSFVLKDKGLEKLDGTLLQRKDGNASDNNDQAKYVEEKPLVSPHKKTNFLRVPSKLISPAVDSSGYQIDVKSINVRNLNDRKEQLGQGGRPEETLSRKTLKEQPLESNYVPSSLLRRKKSRSTSARSSTT